MKTININGKKYTKEQFCKKAEEHDTGRCLYGESYGYIEFLSEIFQELKSDFPRHEPEPPTVRPMSELPPNKRNVLFLIGKIHDKENKNLWTCRTGYANTICRPMVYCDNSQFGLSDNWQSYSNGGRFLIGWLPLPNPNDIKL